MPGKSTPLFRFECSALIVLCCAIVVSFASSELIAQPADTPKNDNDVQMPVDDKTMDESEAGPRDDIQSAEPDEEDSNPASERSWRELARASEPVRQAFKDVIAKARSATVEIHNGEDKLLAMGTIVDPSGLVLTKASEMRGEIVCHLADGRKLPAKVFGLELNADLAVLKVDAKKLPAIAWDAGAAPLPVGSWLVTPDTKKEPIAVGVVSVVSRKVSPGGVLGVFLKDNEKGARIDKVIPDSPADGVGILVNDIVTEVNGHKTPNSEKLIARVQEFGPGERIEMKVLRGAKTLSFRPVLGRRAVLEAGGADARSNIQNRMGSTLSDRRTGFTAVIQHDTMLAPNQCGGVVVDINGKAVGVNIARSGRIMSYAIPAKTVLPILKKLVAGELSPESVNKTRLQIIKNELAALNSREGELPKEQERLETEVEKLTKTVDSLKDSIREAEKKLNEAKKELAKADKERTELAQELRSAKRSNRRIESDREKLKAEQEALKKGTFPENYEDR